MIIISEQSCRMVIGYYQFDHHTSIWWQRSSYLQSRQMEYWMAEGEGGPSVTFQWHLLYGLMAAALYLYLYQLYCGGVHLRPFLHLCSLDLSSIVGRLLLPPHQQWHLLLLRNPFLTNWLLVSASVTGPFTSTTPSPLTFISKKSIWNPKQRKTTLPRWTSTSSTFGQQGIFFRHFLRHCAFWGCTKTSNCMRCRVG